MINANNKLSQYYFLEAEKKFKLGDHEKSAYYVSLAKWYGTEPGSEIPEGLENLDGKLSRLNCQTGDERGVIFIPRAL